MGPISADGGVKGLTSEQIETLRDLRSVWPNSRLVLIGASALACLVEMNWRQTHDLDLSASISQAEFPGSLIGRTGWVPVRSREHSWLSPHGVRVDIIPAGSKELAAGSIVWPTTGAMMNLAGFRLVFERAVPIQLTPDLSVEAAPLEVIALLKMVAYLARPQERTRDLEYLSHLLEDFVMPFSAERFSSELLEMAMNYELVSAYLLGAKLAAIVDESERALVEAFVSKAMNEDDPDQTQARMVRAWPWRGQSSILLSRIAAFQQGFSSKSDHEPRRG